MHKGWIIPRDSLLSMYAQGGPVFPRRIEKNVQIAPSPFLRFSAIFQYMGHMKRGVREAGTRTFPRSICFNSCDWSSAIST
jgi:hypothetical protein